MIRFNNLRKEDPYVLFKKKYDEAFDAGQSNIEAISIASYSLESKEVNSRYVNIKIIDNNKFIFFTNYNSPKALEFISHEQIAAKVFWPSTNTQIRMKAIITKCSMKYNSEYFKQRSVDKNALAISSDQSQKINSYDEIVLKYQETKKNKKLSKCPDYWGGFSFTPYYFEFWEGHASRLNKRECYEEIKGSWNKYLLQP